MKTLQKSLAVLLALVLLFSFGAPVAYGEDMENFDFIKRNGGAVITHYGGTETDVVIPAYVIDRNGTQLPVKSVDADVFAYTDVRSVIFPDTVTIINQEQFNACDKLEYVGIGAGISRIGVSAFAGCTSLTTFTIPDTVHDLDPGAFRDCTALKTVTIGSGVTNLPSNLFDMCTALETVFCGENTQTINSNTFSGCFMDGGDLYIYDQITGFPLDTLSKSFSGTIHCYPESTIDKIVSKIGWNVAYFTFNELYTEVDTPLQVIENPEPQAVPTQGLRIMAAYTDTASVVPARNVTTKCTFEKAKVFDTVGTVRIPVNYNSYQASFDVTVLENIETGIEVVNAPDKVSYYASEEAQTVQTAGLKVELCYLDGKRVDVTNECTIPNTQRFDTVGAQAVEIQYNDHKTTFAVMVLEDVVTGLEVVSAPGKTSYYESEDAQTVFTDGLRVNRVHISGKRVDVTDQCTIPTRQLFDLVGTAYVMVTYKDYVTRFAVTILENVETGIEIVAAPTKTYYESEDAQPVVYDGLQVNLCFINGKKVDITSECTMPSTQVFDTVGATSVTVSYKDFTADFAVNVVEDSVIGIEVAHRPQKTEYQEMSVAQDVDITGLSVNRIHISGRKVDVTTECVVPSTQVFDTIGPAEVTVTYRTFTTAFTVQVKEKVEVGIKIVSLPTNTLYYAADTLQPIDTVGLRVNLLYSNGTSEDITDRCTVPQKRILPLPGEETMTVLYKSFSDSFPITVEKLQLRLTVNGTDATNLYKKKIGLFSSYKKNPVTYGFDGIEEQMIDSLRWTVTENSKMTIRDSTVTYGKITAGSGLVTLTVTDIHGVNHTVSSRILFYRLNLQLNILFSRFL